MNIGNIPACRICNRPPVEAVETDCCQAIYCLECTVISQSQPCINCRRYPFTWKESLIARQMTSFIPYQCPQCQEKMTMGNSEQHYYQCSSRIRKCDINDCTFEAPNDEFFAHLIQNHKKEVLLSFDKDAKAKLQSSVNTSSVLKAKENQLPLEAQAQKARIGSSGKYYCGGRLETNCSCCNGHCGPDNGCNCRLCMALDIRSRGLAPGNWVNRNGSVSRPQKGALYCGEIAKEVFGVNLRCDPLAKIQCKACKTLQSQIKDRYFGLN